MKVKIPVHAHCSQCFKENSQEFTYEQMGPNIAGLIIITLALFMYGFFGLFSILILCFGTLLFRRRHLILICHSCKKAQSLDIHDKNLLNQFIKQNQHRFLSLDMDNELKKMHLHCLEFDKIIAEQWNCHYCEEENPGHFHVCWNCSNQRTPPGIEFKESLYGPAPSNMLANPLSPNEIRFDKNHLE
jgi:hypothetical protein